MNSSPLMSVAEASQYSHIARSTMYRLVKRPDFPTVRIGRSILINKARLDEWIDQNTASGETVELPPA